jgi:lycopene cyclase domain-containing protein
MTYPLIVLPFLAITVVAVLATLRRPRFGARMAASAIAALVLLALTAVFDNAMIALDLFTYPPEHVSGLRIGLAPIEDFSYPLCAAFGVPALFTLLSGRGARMTALSPGRVARELLVSSRPVSWINTAFPFAAGYLLTAREIDLVLVLGTLFFLVPYNLAMYGINDVFDYESDLRNPRKGGAHGAVLDRRMHRTTLWASGVACAPFVVFLVVVGSPLSWLVLAASLFFVVFYSAPPLRLKERPFADSVTSSIHFFSPAVYGLVLAGAVWTWQLALVILAFGLWGVASHAFGAVQDVAADRAAAIASIATARGARWTVRFALACYLLAGVVMLPTAWPGPLAALLVVPYLAVVWPYRSVDDATADRATRGWKQFLWVNQLAGFGATLLLIWWAILTA